MFFLLFIISVPLVFFANPKRNLDNGNGNKVMPEIEHNLNYWREFKEDFKKDGGKNLKKETFNNLEENYYYDDNTHSAKYIIKKKPPHFENENEKFVDQQEYDVEPIEAFDDDNHFVSDDEPKKHILKVRENVDPELLEIEKNLEQNEKSSEEEISEQKESTTPKQVDNNNNNIEVNFHEYINKSNVNIVLSKPFTSPTYSNIPITKFFVNVFKFVLRGKEILNYPVNALSDNMKEGHCYSFQGQTGNITIDLKTPLLVRAVSIEHPRTTHPSSTPKTFSVFSFSAQSIDQLFLYENHGKYIATNLEFPKGTVGPKIYSFTPVETRFIQFRFLENHGDPHYTCIYRLNVYL